MLIGRLFGYLTFFTGCILFLKFLYYGIVDQFMFSPLGQTWYQSHRESLNGLQAFTQRYLFPEIWDPGIQWILLQPDWIVLVALGILSLHLFRRR